jgi:hypothetical protein
MRALFILLSFVLIIFTSSCNNKVVPLKHQYQSNPYQFSSASSRDVVWNKLIDFLTASSLAIKMVDKNSGLITTDNTSFLDSFAWENKEGNLTNPSALVVCSKVRGLFTFGTSLKKPDYVTGQWTIRIKEETDSITVAVKLANAAGQIIIGDQVLNNGYSTRETYNLAVKSTGVFEKSIEDALK